MKRLYEITYNKDQWACEGNREDGYTLISKDYFYFIDGDTIGIEQIDDDSFFIYRTTVEPKFKITHLKLADANIYRIYEQEFENFHFLTDDTILFDNKSVYSISKRREVQEFNWLKNKELKVYSTKKNQEKFLLVKQKLKFLDEYVQVFVDIKTFKPVTSASSSLRDKHSIKLSESYTFDDLVAEDNKYSSIIQWYEYYLHTYTIFKGEAILIQELEKKNK